MVTIMTIIMMMTVITIIILIAIVPVVMEMRDLFSTRYNLFCSLL